VTASVEFGFWTLYGSWGVASGAMETEDLVYFALGALFSDRAEATIKIDDAVHRVLVPRKEERCIRDFFRLAEPTGWDLAQEALRIRHICKSI
jgi:hypothetical protein